MLAELRPCAPDDMPLRCSTDGTSGFSLEGAAELKGDDIKEPVYP